MRFVTFNHDGRIRAGWLEGDADHQNAVVIDLGHPGYARLLEGVEPALGAMIATGLEPIVKRLSAHPVPATARIPGREVELLAPLPCPPRIIGIAHNYRCALAERGMSPPEVPVVFEKDPSTVIAPGAAIVLPADIGGVTYEAELAAVIGIPAASVSRERALDHVAGYTIFNDVSASEVIRLDGRFDRGKNFATFGPMGPYLATPDEIGGPTSLGVSLAVDDQVLQEGSTSSMLFGVAELVSILSRERPLEPGCVIATGTPAGVAALRSPPTWLRPGSVVTASVDGLGRLVNAVEQKVPTNV